MSRIIIENLKLSDKEKLIYNLRFNDDGSIKMEVVDIAKLLNITRDNVQNTLSQTIDKQDELIANTYINDFKKTRTKNIKYKDLLKQAKKQEKQLGYRWHNGYRKGRLDE